MPGATTEGPRIWVVEIGAVYLPLGNPSRLTTFEVYESEEAARDVVEKCEFAARWFVVPVPPPEADGSVPMATVTEEMKRAGVRELFNTDLGPKPEAWEEKIARVFLAMRAAGVASVEPSLLDALKAARQAAHDGGFPIGWNIDRLDEVIAAHGVGGNDGR